ncbi:hypothetical protein SAMN05192575_101378 [Nocardioides alpinus]|uniref:Uncharacterized protein n=1 Tax=Nocardioides alpinus TaxID=748909 RepID=A0A1I0VRI4_9ACTN|nr:hypothetical protein [Nocardioides alpinus]PKH37406.1 hypothetical protein CXG46_18290 [Nocardioides alpinus]SFA78500.1 hypothetical protein SAMN05192575_101378 [Nocardioides alpinus]
MRPLRGARTALVVLACLGALAACGDDVNTSTDPVEVELGEAFEWNSFAVDDGWELNGVKRSAGSDEVTTPEVKGTITNLSDEERAAIFEMVFSADGEPLATVNCAAAKMTTDQSQQFLCPGLSATMPEDYDAVVVQEFTR